MKGFARVVPRVFALAVLGSVLVATAGPYDSWLTAADISQVSGIKDAKLIPRDPMKGAGGDLNFATADDKLIVMVQIVDKSHYAGYKQMFFKAEVPELGDQAMRGTTTPKIPGSAVNLVAFTKGAKCVALTSFVDMAGGKSMLTPDQLIALAKIIAGRM